MERHVSDTAREQQRPRPPVRLQNQVRAPPDIIHRFDDPKAGIARQLNPLPDSKEIPPKRHIANSTGKDTPIT